MSATTPTARNMTAVRALFPECFALSIPDAVAAATDKVEAINLIARAIIGASLEFGHSGNDARIKSARETLQGKGKGQQVRARAVLALDAVRDGIKARELCKLDDAVLCDWVVVAMAQAVDALTPPPVVRKVAAPAVTAPAVTAPAASVDAPDVTAPAASVDAPDVTAPAVTAPAVTAPATTSLNDVLAVIASHAFTVDQLMQISRAIAAATPGAPVVAETALF